MTQKANADPGGRVHTRSRRGRGSWILALLAVALPACTSLRRPDDGRPAAPPPPPSFSSVTAPIDGRGATELDMLERGPQLPGARLRQAYILQENHENRASLEILNLVLYGDDSPDRQVEALARWLRARAFERLGEDDRAAFELDEARDRTSDPSLVAAIGSLEAQLRGTTAPSARARPAALTVLDRGEWRAASANERRMRPMGRIGRITIHHSAGIAPGRAESAAAGAIRGIQRYHQQEQGWGDIGYHFLIDPAGRVWTGRALSWQGAHAGDDERNRGNVGICLLGNFVPGAQGEPPAAQVRAMDDLVRALCTKYRVPPEGVLTHLELKDTSCPGPYLQVAVQRLRAQLASEAVAARP